MALWMFITSSSLNNFQIKVKDGSLVDNGAFDTEEDWYDEEQ